MDNQKPLRLVRRERRERQAQERGWTGPWPPERARIGSAADCEHYLARLEDGEQRAGFLAAIAENLTAFFTAFEPEHFRRFARVLLDVAENPQAAHRSRLRAVQAALKPLRRALPVLARLQRAEDKSLQNHLERLLRAFCEELAAGDFARRARVLVDLAGPAAKTASDKVRAVDAALGAANDALAMLSELRGLAAKEPYSRDDDPEMRLLMEQGERKLREIEAEILADEERMSQPALPSQVR